MESCLFPFSTYSIRVHIADNENQTYCIYYVYIINIEIIIKSNPIPDLCLEESEQQKPENWYGQLLVLAHV